MQAHSGNAHQVYATDARTRSYSRIIRNVNTVQAQGRTAMSRRRQMHTCHALHGSRRNLFETRAGDSLLERKKETLCVHNMNWSWLKMPKLQKRTSYFSSFTYSMSCVVVCIRRYPQARAYSTQHRPSPCHAYPIQSGHCARRKSTQTP